MVGNSPVMQFAKKATERDRARLANDASPTAVGAGYGQKFGQGRNNAHAKAAGRQKLFLNMMRFAFNQRGI